MLNFGEREFLVFPLHSVEKWKIWSHWKNISSNQLFSDLFISRTVAFTKFLLKKCERLKFHNLHTVHYTVWILGKMWKKKLFRQINFTYALLSRNFCHKSVIVNFRACIAIAVQRTKRFHGIFFNVKWSLVKKVRLHGIFCQISVREYVSTCM